MQLQGTREAIIDGDLELQVLLLQTRLAAWDSGFVCCHGLTASAGNYSCTVVQRGVRCHCQSL